MLPFPSGLGSLGITSHSLPPDTLVPTKFAMISLVLTRTARMLVSVWLYTVKLRLILCCTWALLFATDPRNATITNAFKKNFIVLFWQSLPCHVANVLHSDLIRVLLDNPASPAPCQPFTVAAMGWFPPKKEDISHDRKVAFEPFAIQDLALLKMSVHQGLNL